MTSEILKRIIFFIIFFVTFSYILIINHLTPVASDDFIRILDFSNLSNFFLQLVSNVKREYFAWTGRITVISVEYLLLPNIFLYNIINSIVSCLFIYGIFLIANLRAPKKTQDLITFLYIIFILWFFIPEFAEVFFWKTGASSYLWPLTGTLFFLYPFLQLYNNTEVLHRNYLKIIVIFSGLLLGMCHEDLSIPISLLLIGINTLYFYRNKKIPLWCLLSTLTYIISTAILIYAPGNYVRNQATSTHEPLIHKAYELLLVIYKHYCISFDSLPLLLLFLAVFLFVLLEGWVKNSKLRSLLLLLFLLSAGSLIMLHMHASHFLISITDFLLPLAFFIFVIILIKNPSRESKLCLLFIGLSLLTAFTMVGSPYVLFGNRTAFFADIFFIIAMFSLLAKLTTLKYWQVSYAVIGLSTLLFLIPSALKNYANTKVIYNTEQTRQKLISVYKKNNITTALLQPASQNFIKRKYNPNLLVYTPHIVVRDFQNFDLAKFHHFHTVVLLPFVELWEDIRPQIDLAAAKANFSIFVKNRTLFLLTTRGSCNSLSNKAPLFVQIYPQKNTSLAKKARKQGFDNLELDWTNNLVTIISPQGQVENNLCALAIYLPNYSIKKIEAGQFNLINSSTPEWSNQLLQPG